MTVYFFDTSAFVRLYTAEPGWVQVRNMVRSAAAEPATAQVCTCDLVLPEAVSALQQIASGPEAARRGLSRSALRQTLPRVRADLAGESPLVLVPASACMGLAAEIVERQQIRGADAVHIAAAITARDTLAGSRPFAFVSHDARQWKAAEREGLHVIDPV